GESDRNAAAKRGIETAANQNPRAFFTETATMLVTAGNFEDDLGRLAESDWIIEAVTENLGIKRNLWERVGRVCRGDAILATNTSGIPLRLISEGWPSEMRRQFLGTHFFNPPRYLHLVEVIPGAETDPSVLDFVSHFCDVHLGKGVVRCKDTPNFIGNRIGSFFGSTVTKIMVENDYTIEEVEALTGPVIGLPNSASFRLFDIIGLDIWIFVAKNLYDAVPDDPWRERFLPPPFVTEMMNRRWLGEKTGQGFFKRVGPTREIHALDWKKLDYHPVQKARFASVEDAKQIQNLGQRLRTLVAATDRAGAFLWALFRDVFLYSAERIPEISDRIVEIDRAMRWGYAHTLGPFELWDALGFEATARRIESDGRALPENVRGMLTAGATAFYRNGEYFDLVAGEYKPLEPRPGIALIAEFRKSNGVIEKNAGASLVDIRDGVLCLEFHSKMNSLGEDAVGMMYSGLERAARDFRAMVIANDGENFSVGANLMLVLVAAQDGDWEELDLAVRRFQGAAMALKYAPIPVVAAPFARVLGGGCEIAMHCTRMQAAAETYMGLVEVGVGVIPAGGGCKELIARLKDPRRVFELIGMARVSTSAEDARDMGLLHKADRISMNRERLLCDARAFAVSLVAHHAPGAPRTDIKVSGDAGFAAMKLGAWLMRQGEYISDHDMLIGEKLAHVLSGGRGPERQVSEQHLLDLEREAFLSLCGTTKTQERMAHMLKTGKPLRN
ncbi:MAG TPA: 3-hydroxyacyl-CoA dehydrogenase/enoyl-CoA hydratase family protein, partial [Bryobacteraceae bacterium]|nr:3-hydroxyacyl-CoA dehydrogenase/enoyl-CoA hydratase family protein [Bryobacteraceae bacterium]